jgi:hypothetical protein
MPPSPLLWRRDEFRWTSAEPCGEGSFVVFSMNREGPSANAHDGTGETSVQLPVHGGGRLV